MSKEVVERFDNWENEGKQPVTWSAKKSAADNCICEGCFGKGRVTKITVQKTHYHGGMSLKTEYRQVWLCDECVRALKNALDHAEIEGDKRMETIEFMVKRQHFPGWPQEVTVTRQYVKLAGEWVELYRTADCLRHLITADKTRHFCLGYNNAIHELPPPTCTFMCGHVCDEMKRKFRAELEAHGKWFTEDEKRRFQEFLSKENTVEWDDGYKNLDEPERKGWLWRWTKGASES
jgi:hypothetical protein